VLYVRERAQRRLADIEAAVHRERIALGPVEFQFGEAAWSHVVPGHAWRGAESAAYFRGRFTVPPAWAGERVGLFIDFAGGVEPLLYLDGTSVQALDYNHSNVLLYDSAAGGETHDFAVEAWAPTRGGTFTLQAADLVYVDRDAYALFYDWTVALQALDVLPPNGREYQSLLLALDDALCALDYTQADPNERPGGSHRDLRLANRTPAFYASLPQARQTLRAFFDTFKADENREPALTLSGHAHVDVAWLWSLENTKRKIGRTFATALRLMDEFPEYVFTQSQPQLYAWAKERYPELYEQIKARVAEKRWEPTGAMWVEADCNLPSGESLIRQILFGRRFFQREFGIETKVLWLPDVFGCPAGLPQIIKGCGLSYFLTTKLSWNQTNRMPNDTFFWRGLDGTEVLTHFVTTPEAGQTSQTYNGVVDAASLAGAWDNYRQKNENADLLFLFGAGDGGGGPTRHDIEAGRRFADLAGFPRCTFGRAEDYFERLGARMASNSRLPVWAGELYLETHRGTYTSQARNKKANRESETLYHDAELFSALTLVELEAGYPQADLNRGWELILLNQFHDILPGSSIAKVYEESRRQYETVAEIGNAALNAALDAIAAAVDVRRNSVVVFNPTDTVRESEAARVTIPADLGDVEFTDKENAPLPAQVVAETETERTYLVLVSEPAAMGYDTLTVYPAGGPQEASTVRADAEKRVLENDFVRVTFDAAGEIVSLIHKQVDENNGGENEREITAPGQTANALTLFEDKPLRYDAWDVDVFYKDKPYPLREIGTIEAFEVVENGPVRAGFEIRRRFLGSTLTQRVFLYAHSPRVEFETDVDWRERQMLLKAAFPVAVNAARATYGTQFGAVERPTHRNTGWDAARFEVCGHRWADLSEGDYGVSLLTDGTKYGYDVHENVLRLTLLKGAVSPDPNADQGRHTFTYALLPHDGDWRMETLDEAYALGCPLLSRWVPARPGGSLPATYTLATLDDTRVVIETIKKAEDRDDALVIRVYEAMNTRGTATLTFGFEIAQAWEVNLVEENPVPVPHKRDALSFAYRPFEIKTFLVKPRR